MRASNAIRILAGVMGFIGAAIDPAAADCVADGAAAGSQGRFTMHLSADCTVAERESRAIDAASVLAALKQGQAVDLSGVVIRGDLALDSLPVSSKPPAVEGVAIQQADQELRVVAAGVSIVNSVVQGTLKHQSPQGLLFFTGPVTFAGTRFERTVDLSRAVFAQPVTLSGAVFLGESYFVQGRFLREVTGEKTAFGPHTRFHRSQFHGPVTFQQSGFSGLTEFLEVTFDRDANFSRTYFKQGTGFSGSRFTGMTDFSEALFDGDAFFTFARFDGDAFFRRTTFRATADFDDAEFNAREDFSKAFFEKGPQFARAKRSSQAPDALGVENPQIQYAITLSLLLFSVLLIAYLIRSK
ncbi:MAG TPA: pentapeptide repeat-containing protein [Nitrospira sp.]|nr:pentapeptide repeat-containing protein [Nitrospira sp.]